MKRAIICFNCEKLKKESESYSVKVEVVEKIFPSPEIKGQGGGGIGIHFRISEVKTKICRACAKKMGYKVKTLKKGVTK